MKTFFTRISGSVTAPQGFRAAGVAAGIKANGKKDVALIVSDRRQRRRQRSPRTRSRRRR
jgi:N-acetylglutamate synthase/N-acetylornithine aminotransferase